MEPIMSTCGQCKAKQDVTTEAENVRDVLGHNEFGDFTWQCKKCGTVNHSRVLAPLDR